MAQKKPSNAKSTATKYFPTICEYIVHKFGYRYKIDTTPEAIGKWRGIVEYNQEIENFLIERIQFDLINLPCVTANSTNPDFLRKVAFHIAKYMARYTIRAPRYNLPAFTFLPSDDIKTQQKKRQSKYDYVEADMMKKIWDENQYVKNLFAHQAARRKRALRIAQQRKNMPPAAERYMRNIYAEILEKRDFYRRLAEEQKTSATLHKKK